MPVIELLEEEALLLDELDGEEADGEELVLVVVELAIEDVLLVIGDEDEELELATEDVLVVIDDDD